MIRVQDDLNLARSIIYSGSMAHRHTSLGPRIADRRSIRKANGPIDCGAENGPGRWPSITRVTNFLGRCP